MVTESSYRLNNLQTVCKREIKSGMIVNRISAATRDFFIYHSRDVTDSEWEKLMDQLVDIINAERN
ncbi:MAG: hypothetical protein GX631_07340 [Dehalococcoidales bacterium]|jgi:hypothetical protein|nr:hypothetical protein [Dehalococcoidales bacterium]